MIREICFTASKQADVNLVQTVQVSTPALIRWQNRHDLTGLPDRLSLPETGMAGGFEMFTIDWKTMPLKLLSGALAGMVGLAFGVGAVLAAGDGAIGITPDAPPPSIQPQTPPPIVSNTPPPLPVVPDISVFVAQNGKQTGPFNRMALQALVTEGKLTGTSMVWMKGMADWAKASTVEDLKPVLTAAAPAVGPAFDARRFVVGSWTSAPTYVQLEGGGQGLSNSVFSYNADGTATTRGTIDIQGQNGPVRVNLSGQGTYTVQPVDSGSFTVNPRIQITLSVPGQAPVLETFAIPFLVRIVDQNTVMDDDGTRWTRN
jgi:GYF domain 2